MLVFQRSGDIWLLNRLDQSIVRVTSGPGDDSYPIFANQGSSIIFHRKIDDTNHNGVLDHNDLGALWEIDLENRREFQISSDQWNPIYPSVGNDKIFANTHYRGVYNIASIPRSGQYISADFSRFPLIHLAPSTASLMHDRLTEEGSVTVDETLSHHILQGNRFRVLRYSSTSYQEQAEQFIAIANALQGIPLVKANLKFLQQARKSCTINPLRSSLKAVCLLIDSWHAIKSGTTLPKNYKKVSSFLSTFNSPRPEIHLNLELARFLLAKRIIGEDQAFRAFDKFCREREIAWAPQLARTLIDQELIPLLNLPTQLPKCDFLNSYKNLALLDQKSATDEQLTINDLIEIFQNSTSHPRILYQTLLRLEKYQITVKELNRIADSYAKAKAGFYSFTEPDISQQLDQQYIKIVINNGDYHRNKYEFGFAIDIYRSALKVSSSSLLVYKRLIDTYYRIGKLEYACQKISEEKNLDQYSKSYLDIYCQTYRIDQAKSTMDRILVVEELIPQLENIKSSLEKEPSIHQTLGWLYYQHHSLSQSPRNTSILNRIRQSVLTAIKFTGGEDVNYLAKSIWHYEFALSLYKTSTPGYFEIQQNLAEAHFQARNYGLARYYYNNRLKSPIKFPSKVQELNILINSGRSSSQDGALLEAIKTFDKALKIARELKDEEKEKRVQYYLAINHEQSANLDRANEIYNDLLRHSTQSSEIARIHLQRSQIFLAQKAFSKSIKEAEQAQKFLAQEDARELENDDTILVNLSGEESYALGFNNDILRMRSHMLKAKALTKLRRYRQAADQLIDKLSIMKTSKKAAKLSSPKDRSTTSNNIAFLYFLNGEYEKSSNWFQTAIINGEEEKDTIGQKNLIISNLRKSYIQNKDAEFNQYRDQLANLVKPEELETKPQDSEPLNIKRLERARFIEKEELWKYLLIEDLEELAYTKLVTEEAPDRFDFLPIIVNLCERIAQKRGLEAKGNEEIYRHLYDLARTSGKIFLNRLARNSPQDQDRTNPPNSEVILSFFQKDSRKIAIKKIDHDYEEFEYGNNQELKEWLDSLPQTQIYLLMTRQGLTLLPTLMETRKNISIVSSYHPMQRPRPSYLASAHFIGGGKSSRVRALKEELPSHQADILHIHSKIEINSSYNSYHFEGLESLDPTKKNRLIILSQPEFRKVPDLQYLHALHAMMTDLNGFALLVPTRPVNWKMFYTELESSSLDTVVKRHRLIHLGRFSPTYQQLLAMASQPSNTTAATLNQKYFYASILNNSAETERLTFELRNLRQSQGRFASAIFFQRKILKSFSDRSSTDFGEEQLNLAILLAKNKEYPAALSTLAEVKAIARGHEDIYLEANALRIESICFERMGELDRGKSALAEAVKLLEEDPYERVEFLLAYGNFLKEYFQDFQSSIYFYNQAIAIFEEYEDDEGKQRAMIDLSVTYTDLGHHELAIDLMESIFDTRHDMEPPQQTRILLSLGGAYLRGAYFEKAANLFDLIATTLSKVAAREGLKTTIEIDYLNLKALTFAKLGRVEESKVVLRQAINLSLTNDLNRKKSLSLSNLAYILRETGDFDQAFENFNLALEIDLKEKDQKAIAYDYRNIGITVFLQNDLDRAEEFLNKSLSISQKLNINYNHIYTLLGLSDISLRRNDIERTNELLQEALTLAEKYNYKDFTWRIYAALGNTAARQDQKKEFIRYYNESLRVVEKMRSSLVNKEFRAAFQAEKGTQAVYEEYVGHLLDHQETQKAWEISERSRSRSFVDSLADSKIIDPPAEFDIIRSLQKKLASPEGITNRKSLEEDLANAMQQLSLKAPKLSNLLVTSHIELKNFQTLIEANTTIVQYMLTSTHLIAWRITQDSISVVRKRITFAEIEENVRLYREALLQLRGTGVAGEYLSELLINDIWPKLSRQQQVGVIPHSLLHLIPFSALPYKDSNIVDHTPIFYLEAASLAPFTLSSALSKQNLNIFAIGNPDRGQDLDLPFAQKEAEVIRRYFPDALVKTGLRADEDSVYSNADRNIIHIASHGEFNQINPADSKLLLSESQKHDGYLTVNDILNSKFQANLFTLSACETGLGKISRGDEIVSFNRALFISGAKSIISTLWRINDVASSIIMKRFYRGLSEGKTKAQALRAAQLVARDYFPHPAYWSSFKLVGSPK